MKYIPILLILWGLQSCGAKPTDSIQPTNPLPFIIRITEPALSQLQSEYEAYSSGGGTHIGFMLVQSYQSGQTQVQIEHLQMGGGSPPSPDEVQIRIHGMKFWVHRNTAQKLKKSIIDLHYVFRSDGTHSSRKYVLRPDKEIYTNTWKKPPEFNSEVQH